MATKQKTYSPAEAARIVGYHYQWVVRLCRDGKIGHRIDVPEAGQHFYRISAKEIRTLKAQKKQSLRQSSKNS